MKHTFKHPVHSRHSINESLITESTLFTRHCLEETRDSALPLRSFLSDTSTSRGWRGQVWEFIFLFSSSFFKSPLHEGSHELLSGVVVVFVAVFMCCVVLCCVSLLFLRIAKAEVGKDVSGKGKGWKEPKVGWLQ